MEGTLGRGFCGQDYSPIARPRLQRSPGEKGQPRNLAAILETAERRVVSAG